MNKILALMLVVSSCGWASSVASALALEPSMLADYHPLGSHPKLEPLEPCQDLKTQTQLESQQVCQTRFGRSSVKFVPGEGEPTLTVQPAKGTAVNIKLETLPMYFEQMYAADLNRDGREDYVLELPWGGNGLAAEGSVVVFVISNKTGYRVTALDTLLFDPNAVVRLGGGNPSVIHTTLVYANGPDGRGHNFWVNTFFRVQGDTLVQSARAPIWVQYAFKPRAVPTQLLTNAEKKRAWAEYLVQSDQKFFVTVKK